MSFIDRKLVEEVIEEQRMVDSGVRAWATSDPMRVAVESLRPFYPKATPVLRRVKSSTSREVFRWRNGKTSVTVVVTRPYWLSFFAKSSAIAWVATAIQEAGCR